MKKIISFTTPLLLLFTAVFFSFKSVSAEEAETLTDHQKSLIRQQIDKIQSDEPKLNAYMVYRSRSDEIVLAVFQEPSDGYIADNWEICYTQKAEHVSYTYAFNTNTLKWDRLLSRLSRDYTRVNLTQYAVDMPENNQIVTACQSGQVLYANFAFKDSSGTVFFDRTPLTTSLTSTVQAGGQSVVAELNRVGETTTAIAASSILLFLVLATFLAKSFPSLLK